MSKEFKSRGFKKFKLIVISFVFIIFSFYTLYAARYTLSLYTLYPTRYTLISVAYAGIAGTKHDLSAGGGQTIRAQTVTQKCVFCHTPHHASGVSPLWNRDLSTATYTVPNIATFPYLLSTVPQPDKGSKLCLSCHDGTVAIGQLINIPGPGMGGMVGMTDYSGTGLLTGEGKLAPCPTPECTTGSLAYLGTDISWKHPVSIALNDTLINNKITQCSEPDPPFFKLKYPASGSPVKLAPTNAGPGVQCRSCHDPHNNPYNYNFLVVDYLANSEELCLACHSYCSE